MTRSSPRIWGCRRWGRSSGRWWLASSEAVETAETCCCFHFKPQKEGEKLTSLRPGRGEGGEKTSGINPCTEGSVVTNPHSLSWREKLSRVKSEHGSGGHVHHSLHNKTPTHGFQNKTPTGNTTSSSFLSYAKQLQRSSRLKLNS